LIEQQINQDPNATLSKKKKLFIHTKIMENIHAWKNNITWKLHKNSQQTWEIGDFILEKERKCQA